MTNLDQRRAAVQPLVDAAAEWMIVTPAEIWDTRRTAVPSLARHGIWYVLRDRGWTYKAIAELWRRDHGTVHSGVKRIERLLDAADADVRRLVLEVKHAEVDRSGRTVLPMTEAVPRWAQPVIA